MPFVSRGAFVALVTPFDAKGRIDRKTLEQLVVWQIEQGTDGIVLCGATGEGMTLPEADRKKVVAICVAAAGGRIPILANSGTADTRQSIRLTEQMLKLGASGCLITTPYYNKPMQKGCVLHFTEIAKVGLPVVVYNNPGRTARLEAETIAEIAQFPGIAGYKDSSGDLQFIRKVRQLCSIPMLSGDDHLTYDTLKEGGSGAISVIGNLIPKTWKEMIALALDKKWEASKAIADRYLPLCKALFLETNPQCVKFAMSWMGKCRGDLRLPLIPPAAATQDRIKQTLIQLSLPQFRSRQATALAAAASIGLKRDGLLS